MVDESRDGDSAGRAPLAVFAVVIVAAFVFYVALARTQWFFSDEWEFLSGRGVNVHDLVHPHYGHLVAVPLIAYRALWAVVGLRSYLPYAGVTIALHLTAAVLLRVIMRRAGVGPWTATAAASVFALFGAGAQDILWAFQITFTAALVFGLVHLLLADHDGPIDRRDWLGIGAGLLGLMCSGVAVTMVLVVAIAALLGRSWRVAALHSAPLALVYGVWWLAYSHGKYAFAGSTRQIFDWWTNGAAGLFRALGSVRGVGWVLVAVLVSGVVLALRESGLAALRRQLVLPTAMLIGAAAFLLIAALDRSGFGSRFAVSSRYLHILAALALPAIAVAIDALFRRSRVVGVVAMAALLVGVPGNIAKANDFARAQRPVDDATKHIMLAIPRAPLAREVPSELRPDPGRAPTLTVGWLLAGVASGRIPSTRASTPVEMRTNRLRLSLMQTDRRSRLACRPLRSPVVVKLAEGDEIGVVGRAHAVLVGGGLSAPVAFGSGPLDSLLHHTLVVVKGPLTVRFAPTPAARFKPKLCTS